MTPRTTSPFDLPPHLSAKADPTLIGADEEQFAAIARCLRRQIDYLNDTLADLRTAPGGKGRGAMDRDLEIHRLSARLRLLQRFGLDICLGRTLRADGAGPMYLGRVGLTDADDRQLLIDWRTPAAEPYFAATHANPMGLASRRRYRWTGGRVTDYWDEVFTPEGLDGYAALDDQSAFIASLGASRSPRMRDVLATIQADQDAVIRAGSHGALVVEGGPGTGKTVVALHRAAYLLYADPYLGHHRGGVLFVGPHREFLAYVADVLPSLGEEGVQTCTLRDLVLEGAEARAEADLEVARLKSDGRMVAAIEPAVTFYEEPPSAPLKVDTYWSEVLLTPADWVEAFESPDPVTSHNEARDDVWEALLDILVDKHPDDEDVSEDALRRSLAGNEELTRIFRRAWPLLESADVVSDLWSVPAYLRRCAPWLSPEDVTRLRRDEGQPWTVSDLPLLDAARQRVGDPEASTGRRRSEAAVASERARMDDVVHYLLETDDDPESSLNLLRRESLRQDLVDDAALPGTRADLLAGPFSHIIVDEAQELTDAEWQMLLRRCPSRSFTIVGDRAQARHGFTISWPERLEPLGFHDIRLASLSINYRTPEEVMAEAEPVIRAVYPDANVPVSVRTGGSPVRHSHASALSTVLREWLAAHPEGMGCVIGAVGFEAPSRIQSLTPEHVKGLEFDLVVLVDPQNYGSGIEGVVDQYVAMTRATQQLVILTSV